jgi:hypothetical protein
LPATNKIISYRYFGNTDGNYALCTSYNDRVRITENGGLSWDGIPGSESLPNRQFKTIEVDISNPGTRCFVGCDALANEASTYEGILVEGNWTWNQIGDGLEGLDINDLESPAYPGDWLTAATNNGIQRCYILDDDPTWEEIQGDLSEHEIVAIEPIEHDQFMWAATGIIDGHRRLYYSWSDFPPWEDYAEVEVGDPLAPFDKEVKDMAVILQPHDFQSVYIAAQEGLYLLDIKGVDHIGEDFLRHYIDFQNDPDYPEAPFRYDFPVLSVDYYKESDQTSVSYILVGTVNNVYLITETRSSDQDHQIDDISITEINEGTFLSNVTSITIPEYYGYPDYKTVLTNQPEGLIKKGDFDSWELKAASDYFGSSYEGTDIVAERTGPGEGQAIAAFTREEAEPGHGLVMYPSATW